MNPFGGLLHSATGEETWSRHGKVQLRRDAVAGPVSCVSSSRCGSSASKGGRTDKGEDRAWDFPLSCSGVSEGLKPGTH